MHKVIQELIREKWRIFGRFGAILAVSIHFVYVSIWIWLAIFLPTEGKYYETGIEWRLFLEIAGVLLTFYFIVKVSLVQRYRRGNQHTGCIFLPDCLVSRSYFLDFNQLF